MTTRLYYDDAYTMTFSAQITERLTASARPAVVLDRSYFYPASGGQPCDTGTLGGTAVVDVFVREADHAVVHVLESDIAGDAVEGRIDWARRFDHMQHHTGQHMLTQAFVRVAGAETISFHLGADSVTIDLDKGKLKDNTIAAAEDLANQMIMANVPVRAYFPPEAEIASLPLRKMPDVTGRLRVVWIGDADDPFDVTACGGTHVARAGEIGQIKVIRTDRQKSVLRIEFRCGQRALDDYRAKNALLNALAANLTTGWWEVDAAYDRLRAENKALRADLRAAQKQLMAFEAVELAAQAAALDGFRLVRRAWDDRDPGDLRVLASTLVAEPGMVVLFGLAGEKAQLVLARSADLGFDMVAALHAAMRALTGDPESTRGGGRPDFAQGGGVSAGVEALESALQAAADSLTA